ncbi:MAG: Ig-like domain-containing protein [Chloroflexota bacterium]|nr:Ig-like domain-containing protein [Chloroflexota bacterium]
MRSSLWIVSAVVVLLLSACNLSSLEPTPTPEVNVPLIEFLFPANNTVVVEGTDVQIQLLAQDPRGVGVARVELYVDDVKVSQALPEVSAAVQIFTVNMNWLAQGIGFHALSAIAYRPDGTLSDPMIIRIEVIGAAESTPAVMETPLSTGTP